MSSVVEVVRREATPSTPSAEDTDRLEAFENGVYATLSGNVDGYADMRTLLEDLR